MRSAQAHGKCILAGEHTVLRGGTALIWPLPFLRITATWMADVEGIWLQESLRRFPLPESKALWSLIQPYHPKGPGILLSLNEMFLGQGLGGSAAIAVAIARLLTVSSVVTFAQRLEDVIHGKSSGADIAGALATLPIQYRAPNHQKTIQMTWEPLLFLSYGGEKSETRSAIQRITYEGTVDVQMNQAVDKVVLGLQSPDQMTYLAEGLMQAGDCFHKWGLVTPAMEKQMNLLMQAGALAVKPTGAGLGGAILSLWDHLPPADLSLRKIGFSA